MSVFETNTGLNVQEPPSGAGPPGPPGPAGPEGPPGSLGPMGNDGSDGEEGYPGTQGPPGFQGPQGFAGSPGYDGVDGEEGSPGVQGPPGWQGPQGTPGPPGDDGTEGSEGSPGVQGPPGFQGPPGLMGPPGEDGQDGPECVPGMQGPPGFQGPAGPMGPPGCTDTVDPVESLVSGPTTVVYAVPTFANKDMAASATAADFALACATVITFTPKGYVQVFINGARQSLGDGVRTKSCYFSSDGGATAKAYSAISAGDSLYWVGTVALFELATTDRVDFDYSTLALAA
jgi:collagen triple helix repeat protein